MGLITKAALGALTGGLTGAGGWANAGRGAAAGATGIGALGPKGPAGPNGPGKDTSSNALLFHILNGLGQDDDALKMLLESANKKRIGTRPPDENPRF